MSQPHGITLAKLNAEESAIFLRASSSFVCSRDAWVSFSSEMSRALAMISFSVPKKNKVRVTMKVCSFLSRTVYFSMP